MSKFTKKQWFIGIDISKEWIDVHVVYEKTPEKFTEKQFKNNLQGFDEMLNWLIKNKTNLSECMFCMEHTGTYGLMLFYWLNQHGFEFCVEPAIQIKRSMGLVRGKNDQVDARRIAWYAMTNKIRLKPFEVPATHLVQIKQLLTYRDQLVKVKTGFLNSLKSHQQYQQITRLDFVTQDIQQQIQQLTDRIDELEKQIIQIINSDEDLKKNHDLATSVIGVGLIISAFMLVTTNNFTSFENGRQYASYSGIAPFEVSSGFYRGKAQVSHLANKRMKTLLANGANSARIWDPELKMYYERKRDQGKEHQVVITAISCKLVNRVFASVHRKTAFVTLSKNYAKKNLVIS